MHQSSSSLIRNALYLLMSQMMTVMQSGAFQISKGRFKNKRVWHIVTTVPDDVLAQYIEVAKIVGNALTLGPSNVIKLDYQEIGRAITIIPEPQRPATLNTIEAVTRLVGETDGLVFAGVLAMESKSGEAYRQAFRDLGVDLAPLSLGTVEGADEEVATSA